MKFNHYYEELGLKPTDFPFEGYEDICDRNLEDEEGFSGVEFFSLDYSLALYIYGRLRYFQDYCLYGHPGYMTHEQWEDIIKKMIKGFELYIKHDEPNYLLSEKERKKMSKNRQKKIEYGFRLFIKYFGHLWY